jgi:type II secretory ATPase GspE/PulE/Tfp pilus assembly ATPase PilB-like protein
VRYEGNEYQLRLHFLPTISGERITIRLVDRRNTSIGVAAS